MDPRGYEQSESGPRTVALVPSPSSYPQRPTSPSGGCLELTEPLEVAEPSELPTPAWWLTEDYPSTNVAAPAYRPVADPFH